MRLCARDKVSGELFARTKTDQEIMMDLQDGKRMFGDLKSKLGFGSKTQDQDFEDEYYDEEYDDFDEEYDDYGEYGYDDGYEKRPSSRGSRDTYTTRSARSTSRSSGVSSPRLVSIDDVRANTQVPASLNRDPLPTRHVTPASSFRGGRTLVDSSVPHQLTPEGSAAQVAASRRRSSEGLDSLFEPTTDTPARASSPIADPAITTRSAYDPYENYSGSSSLGYSSSRSVVVVKPMSYADVERVSRSLKIGDAVVLALANTPDDLSKRVLDFSFGVASALDANVDCIADKVFAITRTKDLTDAERFSLRSQGVL